ncbi:unnamed protein product [Alternaria burnsii]|nr:unnamed protein product [Alternaria burnsii]
MVMEHLDFAKTHKSKPQGNVDSATDEPKHSVTGMGMLTYAEMRAHKHTENPRCACHDIETILALVPENQQNQFVRVYPRPQLRYAQYPTGVSMFREELDMKMTVPRQDSSQQRRPSLDSMIMAPMTAEVYTGNRGVEPDKKQNEQFCIPKVANAVSTFFAQARRAVRFRPALLPTPIDDLQAAKDRLPKPCGDKTLGDVSESPLSPQVTVKLQHCNAVRYQTNRRPRLKSRAQKYRNLGYNPGSEADEYDMSPPVAVQQTDHAPITKKRSLTKQSRKQSTKGATIFEAPPKQSPYHPKRPDSPFPGPQQRTKLPVTSIKNVCKYQRRDAAPVNCPQRHTHTNGAANEPRPPPLRGTKDMPSMPGKPSLPPSVHRDGCLLWQDLGVLKTTSGPALTPLSISRRNYAATDFGMSEHVSKDIAEAVPAPRRFSLESVTSISQSSGYPATEASVPDDVSDGIPEAIPASRRFSLDDYIIAEVVPASYRFPISDSGSETVEVERRLSIDSRFSVGSSTHEGDYTYENHTNAGGRTDGDEHYTYSDTLDPGPRVTRGASVCSSPVCSFSEENRPSLGYYEYAVPSVPDVMSLVGTYSESDSDSSIDQSLFADFDGDHFGTSTPSLTNDTETLPSNSYTTGSDNGYRQSSLEGARHSFRQSLGKASQSKRARTFDIVRSNLYWID